MDVTAFVLAAAGGYLLGSIPFGLLLTRAAGLGDIRAIGSHSIGATNVLRTGRKDIALATLVLDALKAGAALVIARIIWGEDHGGSDEIGNIAGYIAGGAAFVGHCYPVWLGFKGGKGVATFFGVLFAGMWPVGLIAGVVWLAVAAIFRFSSLASLCAAAGASIFALAGGSPDVSGVVFCFALSALIFLRHRANISRLLAGTEPRIGQGKDETPPPPEAEQPPAQASP